MNTTEAFVLHRATFIVLAVYAVQRNSRGEWHVDIEWLEPRTRAYLTELVPPGTELNDDAQLATVFANVLYDANVHCVKHFHPECGDDLPGAKEPRDRIEVTRHHITTPAPIVKDPLALIKLTHCVQTMTRQHDSYKLGKLASELQELIIAEAVRELPGYEERPGTYDGPTTGTPEMRIM
jgi:hypothetical protein